MWLFAIRYYINFDGDTKARPSRLSIAEESSSDVVLHSPSSAEEDVWTSKFYRPWIVRRRTGVSKFTVVVWKRAKKRRFSFLFQCKEAAFFARSWSKKSFANKKDKVAWKARKIEGSKNCGSEQGFSIRGNSQRFAIASEFFDHLFSNRYFFGWYFIVSVKNLEMKTVDFGENFWNGSWWKVCQSRQEEASTETYIKFFSIRVIF